jgi:N-acetylglucosamine kinase-like BadF-type ATPase
MRLFAGIDGGQSSTVAVVGDETGRVLGRGSAGPADEVAQGADSTRLRDALHGALANALADAQLPARSRFASVVAGVSGYDGKVYGNPPDVPADRFALVHDTVIAHAGALGGDAGVVVIAGTGSVAYAKDERGESALVGGWGYLFGDEGSAFWFAREAIADAARASDAGEAHDLAPLIARYFSQPSLRTLVRAFYAGEIARAQLASFAPAVLREAANGNASAAQYADDGAAALVLLARQAATRLGLEEPRIAFLGGLLADAAFGERIDGWMDELMPKATRVAPRRDAAEGALLLAYRGA